MGPSIIWSNYHMSPRLAKPNLNLNHLFGFHDEASRLQAFYNNDWLWRLGVCSILHSWWMFFCILKLLDVILMSSMRFGGFLMLTALLCLESRSFRQFLHVFGMFSKSLVTLQPRLNRVCCCSEHQASRLRAEANSQPTLEVEEVRCQMAA